MKQETLSLSPFSPPTEASIKSFIYHSVPDILDAGAEDFRDHLHMMFADLIDFFVTLVKSNMSYTYPPFWDPYFVYLDVIRAHFHSHCNGMTPTPTPTPTSCPSKMPLLRAISMYPHNHRIWKKSDASHKYVTRYAAEHRLSM